MSGKFAELLERAGSYEFDPRKLDALPITGMLRKSPDPRSCILVISSSAAGDLIVEIDADDVVEHEVNGAGEHAGEEVTLRVRPTAVVTASVKGKLAAAAVPAFVVTSAFGQGVRQPVPSAPWRAIVTPFSRLDVMLNVLDGLGWAECRARGKAECEALHPPGPDRDRCITDRYIACGPPPRLRVDERVLEQLRELVGGPIRG